MDDFRSEYAELMGRLRKLGERYIADGLRSILEPYVTGASNNPSSGGFDAYLALGLSREATEAEVKERFRKLSRLLHPDTAACPGTEFLFNLVNLSYRLIAQERGWR